MPITAEDIEEAFRESPEDRTSRLIDEAFGIAPAPRRIPKPFTMPPVSPEGTIETPEGTVHLPSPLEAVEKGVYAEPKGRGVQPAAPPGPVSVWAEAPPLPATKPPPGWMVSPERLELPPPEPEIRAEKPGPKVEIPIPPAKEREFARERFFGPGAGLPPPSELEQPVYGFTTEASATLAPLLRKHLGFAPVPEPETVAGQIGRGAGALAGFIAGAPMAVGRRVGAKVAEHLAPMMTDSLTRLFVKDIAQSAAQLGAASAAVPLGEAIEAGNPLLMIEAANQGALLGAAFGTIAGAIPEDTLRQTAARVATGLAGLDLATGKQPLDDRALAQKIYDYGLNLFFIFRGRDVRPRYQALQAEANRRGMDADGLYRYISRRITKEGRPAQEVFDEEVPPLRTAAEAGLERRGIEPPEAPPLARRAEPERPPEAPIPGVAAPSPERRALTEEEARAERAKTAQELALERIPVAAGPPIPPAIEEPRGIITKRPETPAPEAEPPFRGTFEEYAAQKGRPGIRVSDPGFLRMRAEYDVDRAPYTFRRAPDGRSEVYDRRTGEVFGVFPTAPAAQIEANRLNAGPPAAEARPARRRLPQLEPIPAAADFSHPEVGDYYGGWEPRWAEPQPERFVEQRAKSKHPGFMTPLTPEDLRPMRRFLSEDGNVGFAVTPEGDIQNVFNIGPVKGAGTEAVLKAIQSGGWTLDAYDGFLKRRYEQLGFVETGRVRFDPARAPKGWEQDVDLQKKPDIVLMRWDGFKEGEDHDAVRAASRENRVRPVAQAAPYYTTFEAAADARGAGDPRHVLGGRGRRPGWARLGRVPRRDDLEAGPGHRGAIGPEAPAPLRPLEPRPPAEPRGLNPPAISAMLSEGGRAKAALDPRAIRVLGANLYSGPLDTIAVKEMLQNAVDSVRPLPPEQRNIMVKYEPATRTIVVSDTGHGMLPEVATEEFVNIGGSAKYEGSSGGFGVAKVAILANAESIIVVTRARNPQGRLLGTVLTGKGEDWAGKGLRVQTRDVTGRPEGTGTYVEVKLSPDVRVSPAETERFLDDFVRNLRFQVNMDVTSGGRRFPVPPSSVEPVETIDIAGTPTEVLASRTTIRTQAIRAFILNNGLPQFEKRVYVGNEMDLPAHVVFDFRAGSPEAPDYPFRVDREGLKSSADSFVESYIREKLAAEAAKRETDKYRRALAESPRIRGTDYLALNTIGEPEWAGFAGRVAGRSYAPGLADALDRTMQDIAMELRGVLAQEGYTNVRFLGLGFGRKYLGLNINGKQLFPGPEAEKEPDRILINPFVIYSEVVELVNAGRLRADDAPRQLARQMAATMLHEVSHQSVRWHDEDFVGVLTRNAGHLMDRLPEYRARLFGALEDPNGWKEFTDDFTAYEALGRAGADPFVQIASDLARRARPPGGEGRPERGEEERPGLAPPVEGRPGGPAEGLAGPPAGVGREPGPAPGEPAGRPAPANWAYWWPVPGRAPIAFYRLTADIPGHPRGSDVSAKTLQEAGFEPPTPAEAPPTAREGEAPYSPRERARRDLEADRMVLDAVKIFGTTEDPFKAGFILSDGRMLDLSEGQDQRADDHRIINQVVPERVLRSMPMEDWRYEQMAYFLRETGTIRFSLSSDGDTMFVDTLVPPTGQQVRRLEGALRGTNLVVLDARVGGQEIHAELDPRDFRAWLRGEEIPPESLREPVEPYEGRPELKILPGGQARAGGPPPRRQWPSLWLALNNVRDLTLDQLMAAPEGARLSHEGNTWFKLSGAPFSLWAMEKAPQRRVPVRHFPAKPPAYLTRIKEGEAPYAAAMAEGQPLFERRLDYAVREGIDKEAAHGLAREALGDLARADGRDLSAASGAGVPGERPARGVAAGGGVRTLGVGIRTDLVQEGRVDLRGRSARTHRELARLAQIYRDPRYETFRIFYVDDAGKILAHEGITSRLPGSTMAFIMKPGRKTDVPREMHEVRERMERLGATGYWLLHNHPSGVPKPSPEDTGLAKNFAKRVPGLRGAVIIDSGTFAAIRPGRFGWGMPEWKIEDLRRANVDRLLQPEIVHDLLGLVLGHDYEVASVGRALQTPEPFVTLLYRSGTTGIVRAIQEMPRAYFARKEGADYIRGRQRDFGASQVFAYDEFADQATRLVGQRYVSDDLLLDYVWPSSGAQREGIFPVAREATVARQMRRGIRVEEPEAPYGPERREEGGVPILGGRPERPEERLLIRPGERPPEKGPRVEERREAALPPPAPPSREPGAPAEAPPPLTEPQFALPRHREILDAAWEYFRDQGVQRDEGRWPVLSDQILDAIREQRFDVPAMEETLRRHGLSLVELGEGFFRPAVKDAARRLAYLSVLQRKLVAMAGRAPTREAAERLLTLADMAEAARREEGEEGPVRAMPWWRRADNVRRGLLVTQLATAVRNFETQMGRLPLDALDLGLQRVFGGKATDPWAPMEAMAKTLGQLRPTAAGRAARQMAERQVDEILEAFPKEWDRLFGNYSSDIARRARESGASTTMADRVFRGPEKAVELLNWANRLQEFATRRSVFLADLDARLRARGESLEVLSSGGARLDEAGRDRLEADAKGAVQKALELTYAQNPAYGSLGWHFTKLVNKMPLALTGPIPFPRFMTNALRFQYEFSPLGFLRLLSEAERDKVRAGDMKALSRASIGTAMFLAAWAVRELQDDDLRWNELRVPGMGVVDLIPFNPFASFFFLGELAKRSRAGTLYKIDSKDIIRGIASANVRGGLGLFALDKVVSGLQELAPTGKIGEALGAAGGELLSGLLVPLRTLTDTYAQFDPALQVVRERREEPLLGPVKGQFGIGEPLYKATREEPTKREAPLLRQLTGLTKVTEKNALERELDRFQFDRREIEGPSTGDPGLDNLVRKHMGQLAEARLLPYVESPDYERLSDARRMDALRRRLNAIRIVARFRAAKESPEEAKQAKEKRRPARERLLREERERERQAEE